MKLDMPEYMAITGIMLGIGLAVGFTSTKIHTLDTPFGQLKIAFGW